MVGVQLGNKATLGGATMCKSLQPHGLSGWLTWIVENICGLMKHHFLMVRDISAITTPQHLDECHPDQISAYQLQLSLPLPAQAVACDFGPLPPTVCSFLLSDFLLSHLSCCWCIYMERFTLGHYLLTVSIYI